jgi:hypothetical protein
MATQKISKAVEDRIDDVLGSDVAWRAAEDALYDAFRKVESINPALEKELTGAWCDILEATGRLAWLDGWQCGRNPDLLVMGPADDTEVTR